MILAALVIVAVAAPAGADHDPEIDRASENAFLVAHMPYQLGTGMQFQRRDGTQAVDGQIVEGPRDYLFAGADASLAFGGEPEGGAIHIFDVTEPSAPIHLAGVECPGYHSDVAIWENYLIQSIDSAGSNTGCTEQFDPDGIDVEGDAGMRIFDVTDPANPVLVRFVTSEELDGGGVHNVTVVGWEGLLYVSSSDLTPEAPRFGFVDLNDPDLPVTMIPMRDITDHALNGCHDIGLDPDRELAFCAAVTATFIWDISDARDPGHVSTIVNPLISIHHGARLAPDGETLVLNDEMAGAAFAPGCLGVEQGVTGALWFYDVADPSFPVPLGSFASGEAAPKTLCTSHFYNFIPGTTLLAVGWYESGMLVVDYEDPSSAFEHAFYRPDDATYWSSYYYRGHVYGNASGDAGGGMWVLEVDGVPDVEPAPQDEGTSWGRWTPTDRTEPDPAPDQDEEAALPSLPATGGGAAALGVAVVMLLGVVRRRR